MTPVTPKNEIVDTELKDLVLRAMKMKNAKLRLSQICCAYINGMIELSYSFSNDRNYDLITLRVVTDIRTKIPSVSDIIPSALYYENEMKELYGLNIQMIITDYHRKLYRINKKSPMLPDDVREQLEAERAARKAEIKEKREEASGENAPSDDVDVTEATLLAQYKADQAKKAEESTKEEKSNG